MKTFISQIRQLFTPRDKRKFLYIAVLMAFSALMELMGIGMLLGAATTFLMPDHGAGAKLTELLNKLLPQLTPDMRICIAVTTIAAVLALKNIFALMIVHIQGKFIFAKRSELAARLFKTFLHADFEAYSKLPADFCFGSFFRINDLGNLVLIPMMQLLADILVIVLLTTAAIWLFPAVSLSGIAFMLLAAAVTIAVNSRANKQNGEKHLAASIEENRWRQAGIAGEKTIKSMGKENFFQNKFNTAYSLMNNFACKLYVLGQIPRLALESASILLACGVFVIMLLIQVDKTVILLTFAVLTAAVGRILPALSRCNYNLTLIRQNYPLLDSICSLLHQLPQEKFSDGAPADAAQTIAFENISFGYEGKEPIFTHFNLTVEPHSLLAVAGKSGRGKSTLVDLLLGVLTPAEGRITAGSVDISGNRAAWRKQLGIVPQNIFLLDGSVAENVAFGEENIDLEKVKTSLQQAGLSEFSPEWQLTAHGNLSGGQKQRIGIARALYADAKVLILDEATSALDAETENAFCEVLKTLRGKVTMLVISHRESTLEICDRIIRL